MPAITVDQLPASQMEMDRTRRFQKRLFHPSDTAAAEIRWRWLPIIGGLALLVPICALDQWLGQALSLKIVYFLPVLMCAWWSGFAPGILACLAAAGGCFLVHAGRGPTANPINVAWNSIALFCTLVLVTSLVSRLRVAVRREREMARTDPLTGAANGRTFYELAAAEAARARRNGQPLTLAYFDLDNFKQLNDKLGHAVGDAALIKLVQLIQTHLRTSDLLARLGGDEFSLLLPETPADGAMVVLTRLQQMIAQEMAQQNWPIMLSVGAVTFVRPSWDVDRMIQHVDTLMYRAKQQGKGRIVHTIMDANVDETGSGLVRRATVRRVCNFSARVRRQGQQDVDEFATVVHLSTDEIELLLSRPMASEDLLIVEPLASEARTLLARVAHNEPSEGSWLHTCELSTRLSPMELKAWLGEPLLLPIS